MASSRSRSALVAGDRLMGDGRGGLRLCPSSWIRYLSTGISLDELRDALRPLLELPVERVLTSHGEPVLRGGRRAIELALAD
jgi:glyoxylase-like metal-dependent hydrolase (beta-lactamase superfamily II)